VRPEEAVKGATDVAGNNKNSSSSSSSSSSISSSSSSRKNNNSDGRGVPPSSEAEAAASAVYAAVLPDAHNLFARVVASLKSGESTPLHSPGSGGSGRARAISGRDLSDAASSTVDRLAPLSAAGSSPHGALSSASPSSPSLRTGSVLSAAYAAIDRANAVLIGSPVRSATKPPKGVVVSVYKTTRGDQKEALENSTGSPLQPLPPYPPEVTLQPLPPAPPPPADAQPYPYEPVIEALQPLPPAPAPVPPPTSPYDPVKASLKPVLNISTLPSPPRSSNDATDFATRARDALATSSALIDRANALAAAVKPRASPNRKSSAGAPPAPPPPSMAASSREGSMLSAAYAAIDRANAVLSNSSPARTPSARRQASEGLSPPQSNVSDTEKGVSWFDSPDDGPKAAPPGARNERAAMTRHPWPVSPTPMPYPTMTQMVARLFGRPPRPGPVAELGADAEQGVATSI